MSDFHDSTALTLVELLRRRSAGESASNGYTFLTDGDEAEVRLSFAELEDQSRRLASALLAHSQPGERAILFFPAGLEFLKGLFACLRSGVIGVPVAYQRLRKPNPVLASIVADSGATAMITTDEVLSDREKLLVHNPGLAGLRWLSVNDSSQSAECGVGGGEHGVRSREPGISGGLRLKSGEAASGNGEWGVDSRASFDPEGVAFLQYTSGSTGSPKGVCLTHRALMHNLSRMQELLHLVPKECVGVTWLPAYHDMGLIGHILQAVHTGADLVLLSPMSFVQKPLRWLTAISRYRATITCGPNFAFEMCARQIKPRDCEHLDLRSWQVACVGAEPISSRVLDEFTKAFEPFGFRREVFYPCYGLAESTLMVTGGHWQATPILRSVSRRGLENETVVTVSPGDSDAKQVVGCGRPIPDLDVQIVDPATGRPCPDDRVGEIWVAGPSVAAGYWDRPEESERTFGARIRSEESARYLRTGDLGFFLEGELFVAGRLKDVIIIRGRKLYPQDVEEVVTGSHTALQGCEGAAFPVDLDGNEELIVVHEAARHHDPSHREAIIDAIRTAIADSFAMQAHTVALIRFNTLPKTSSGKVRRQECSRLFLLGELEIISSRTEPAAVAIPARTIPLPATKARAAVPARTEPHASEHTSGVTAARTEPRPPDQSSDRVAARTEPGPTGGTADPCAQTTDSDAAAPSRMSDGADRPRRSRHEIRRWVVRRLAEHLKWNEDLIDPSRPFAAFGLDSVTMVGISGELQGWLGRAVPPTLLYDAPNIDALSRALTPEEGDAEPLLAAPLGGREPIAIVGMGCRLPGAGSPAEFWQLLANGVDAVRMVPSGRWRHVPGEIATECGGFLESVDRFDAAFFGISPREAAYLDPQHRLLLEVSWEALEDAGLPAGMLAGESVGVFVGVSSNDYGRMLAAGPGLQDAYSVTGNSASMAANRVSYHFDFRGPSLAVDTACSSSLVAVHLACESLRRGECQVALAGGVNLILTPEVSVTLSRAMMLSRSGRCRTFDASADGYVRGEGCGVVVLKPLSVALRDHNRVLAVVLGCAVNQDGKSNGITAPNGQAQAALIRAALADAGIEPEQVGYVESHGTGTVLGDPIEFSALKSALSAGSKPCAVSTVKTNLGHLESAAGIAGLLKAVLQLRHGAIAPHLHLKALNPHIELEGTRFFIPSELVPWPEGQTPRIAGVSSFGFGGSNAHVVLAEAPASVEASRSPDQPGQLLTLSAHTEPALQEIASRFHDYLIEDAVADVEDVTFTASAGRSHRAHRLVVRGEGRAELTSGLAEFLSGRVVDRVQVGRATGEPAGGIAFLFTGQGSQRPGMGRTLSERCAPFRATIARCDAIAAAVIERPLRSILDRDHRRSHDGKSTVWDQVALFAIEFALAETWRSWGIEPSAVLGHSLGEYVAACIAGVFSLEDALQLVAGRARLMDSLRDCGAMAAVLAPLAKVEAMLLALGNPVDVAAVNGPEQVVLSGDLDGIRSMREAFRRERIATLALDVSRAFHSRQIDPILDELERIAANTRFNAPRIPVISNLSGRAAGPEIQTAAYWRRHAREPVLFRDGIESLKLSGLEVFLEVGPDATLTSLGRSIFPAEKAQWLPSLRGGTDEWSDLLDALGSLYVRGASVNWRAFHAPIRRRLISLPTYPFERTRHWVDAILAPARAASSPMADAPTTIALDPERWIPRSRWEAPAGRSAASSLGDLGHVAASVVESTSRPRTRVCENGERFAGANGGRERHAERADSSRPFACDASRETHHAQRDGCRERSVRRAADRFVAAHVQRAFRDLGWAPSSGERWTTGSLGERLGIEPNFHRLLGRMLEILAEDGLLDRDADQWMPGPAAWDNTAPDDLLREVLQRQRDHEAELNLADRCGRHLAAVLRGEMDPLSILFPDGSPDLLAQIYGEAPVARAANRLIAATIAQGLERVPPDRVVRILEIGAGTGGTTTHVLSTLSRRRCEYVFTDLSSLFLNHARERFREHRFVQYRPLDIERDPALSGLAPHQFDIVLAANVLHATSDLKCSLGHARQLLAPRGWLILLEGTGRERILDLVFGLTAGWWKYADLELRPDYPLISRESWLSLLASEGFTDVQAVAPTPDSQQVVFLGRAPSSISISPNRPARTSKTWQILAQEASVAAALSQRLEAEGARCSVVEPGVAGCALNPILGIGACHCGNASDAPCQCAADLSLVDLRLLGEPDSPPLGEINRSGVTGWVVTRGLAEMANDVPSTARWIDLDPAVSLESSLDRLVYELLDPDVEPFVAFRNGQRFVAARDMQPLAPLAANGDAGSRDALRLVDPADRRQRIQDAVCSELARTLSLPVSAIELDRPMVSFGLDSLMAIQLKNRVEAIAGVTISIVKLLEGATVAQLAAEIDESLASEPSRPESGVGFGPPAHDEAPFGSPRNGEHVASLPVPDPIDAIDDLSELELDVLIGDLLVGADEHDR